MAEDVSDLITVTQAIPLIDSLPVAPRKIQLPLQQALGLRLAEDLRADRDYPPLDKSLMDGYAVRSSDVAQTPVDLLVVGESAAGRLPARGIGANEAMTVMTGAPLPPGADAVVPIEQTGAKEFAAAGQSVRILQLAAKGAWIAGRGGDIGAGTVLLPAGTMLRAPQLAVAACVGAATLSAWDRPRCAVLSTGNELVGVDQTPTPAQLRDSNSPMLLALLSRLGYTAAGLGLAGDSIDTIAASVRDGLKNDALFVTGGMSMGQYDLVPRVLTDLGGQLKITKLRIKPGKPFVLAAMPGGQYVLGLPGNPVSAFVCTLRLASRLLARMSGGRPDDRLRTATLAAPLAANGPREFYQPGVWENHRVRGLAWKGSADIFTLARADVLILRPADAPELWEGETVPIVCLD